MEPHIAVPKGRQRGGLGGPEAHHNGAHTAILEQKKTLSQKYLVKKKYFDTTPGASGRSLTHSLGLVELLEFVLQSHYYYGSTSGAGGGFTKPVCTHLGLGLGLDF